MTITAKVQFQCFQVLGVFFLFLCILVIGSEEDSAEVNEDFTRYGVFHSLQTILDKLKDDKFKNNEPVKNLLTVFNNFMQDVAIKRSGVTTTSKRHPLISIEAIYRSRRQALSMMLSKSYGAEIINRLPICVGHLRDLFRFDKELKQLYLALSTYMTSYEVESKLYEKPVIVAGYWMLGTAVNIASEILGKLPPQNSSIYRFPKDLFKPDFVVFLSTGNRDDILRTQETLLNQRLIAIYRNMREPAVYDYNVTYILNHHLSSLKSIIREKLGSNFSHLSYL